MTAGLVICQTDDLNDTIHPGLFWGIGEQLTDYIQADPRVLTHAMQIWATETTFSLTVPLANLSGVVYKGAVQYRTLFDETMQGTLNMTLNRLRSIMPRGRRLSGGDTDYLSFKHAIVSHNILNLSSGILIDPTGFDGTLLRPFASEMMQYAIIDNAAVSIATGEPVKFTISRLTRGNYAFFPLTENSLINCLFKGQSFAGKRFNTVDHFAPHLRQVAHMEEARITPQLAEAVKAVVEHANPDGTIRNEHVNGVGKTIWNGIKSIPSFVVNHAGTIAKIAALLADQNIRNDPPQDSNMILAQLQSD